MDSDLSTIKWLVLNHREPLIFKQFLNWEIVDWNLQHWKELIGKEEMKFRCGKFEYTEEPQWERSTREINLNFADFLEFEGRNPCEWIYYDYKYLRNYFTNIKSLQDTINWGNFGFPELTSKNSTIWIGSKGAHTPCHVDTYGCNLIAQIYGKKRWIIFPPEENLFPTRIPYEESSIYSKLNLFSPNLEKLKGITKCKSIVLSPGEVLLLPHGWWHYVENLETAISINVWIQLPIDDEKRLDESLVQLVVSQFIKDLNAEKRDSILNPNPENQTLHRQDLSDTLDIINDCTKSCRNDSHKKLKTEGFAAETATREVDAKDVLNRFEDKIVTIPYLTVEEFRELLRTQRARFCGGHESAEIVGDINEAVDIVDIINSFTDASVINFVKKKILKK